MPLYNCIYFSMETSIFKNVLGAAVCKNHYFIENTKPFGTDDSCKKKKKRTVFQTKLQTIPNSVSRIRKKKELHRYQHSTPTFHQNVLSLSDIVSVCYTINKAKRFSLSIEHIFDRIFVPMPVIITGIFVFFINIKETGNADEKAVYLSTRAYFVIYLSWGERGMKENKTFGGWQEWPRTE